MSTVQLPRPLPPPSVPLFDAKGTAAAKVGADAYKHGKRNQPVVQKPNAPLLDPLNAGMMNRLWYDYFVSADQALRELVKLS